MKRGSFIGAALAVSFGFAASAQTAAPDKPAQAPSSPPAATAAPQASPQAATPAETGSASDTSATPAALSVGMVVKDPTGQVVGTISQIGETPDGAPSILLDVGGRMVGVLASKLKLAQSGDQAVISMTKAQVQTIR